MKFSARFTLLVAGAALGLSACGDDVTEINENSSIAMLKTGEKLSSQKCDSTTAGQMLYVQDSAAAYLCNGKKWTPMLGKDGSDEAEGKNAENSTNSSTVLMVKTARTARMVAAAPRKPSTAATKSCAAAIPPACC